MIAIKKLINRAAVREAFHRQGARVPRGFLDDMERTVYVVLRRAAAGEIEPDIKINGVNVEQRPLKDETLDRIEAGQKKFFGEELGFLKQSLLKEALREALGKQRVETAWVAHVNAVVGSKISEASVRSGARAGGTPTSVGMPSRVLRAFLRAPESKTMTVEAFCRRWQDAEFRYGWIEAHGERKA